MYSAAVIMNKVFETAVNGYAQLSSVVFAKLEKARFIIASNK